MKAEISVVIPSIKEDIITLESLPEGVPVSIERDGTLNEARNRGVRNADHDIVAILDDDISFSVELLEWLITQVDERSLVGVADWEFGLVAGRVMIFHKNLWSQVGGFDERLRSHNGDTDFAIKAHEAGFDVLRVPREVFHHEEHDRSIRTRDRAWRLAYLCTKHPRYAPHLISSTLTYNLALWTGIDYGLEVPDNLECEIS